MHKTSIILGALLSVAMAHAAVVNANSVCPAANQPVHTYGLPGNVGESSTTLSETHGTGVVTVQDNNLDDCDGDGTPGDFDGDLETGVGGGFFGSSSEFDAAPWNCGYDLNVHAASGSANDLTGLPVGGSWGVDDYDGPTLVTQTTGDLSETVGGLVGTVDPATGEAVDVLLDTVEGLVPDPIGVPLVDGLLDALTDGSTVTSCQVDGSITPAVDADDCIHAWVDDWSAGGCPDHGGDNGYWLFLESGVTENNGGVTTTTATTGTLAADF